MRTKEKTSSLMPPSRLLMKFYGLKFNASNRIPTLLCYSYLQTSLCSQHSAVQKPTKINKYIHTFSVQRNTYSRSFLTISKDTSATRYTLRFLLYVLVLHIIRTAHFHNCIPLPIIGTVLKKCNVLLIFITVLLFLLYCNIYNL